MIHLRRWAGLLGLAGIALALIGLFSSRGASQPVKGIPVGPANGNGNAAGFSSIKIMEDSRFKQVLNVGRDCIKDKEWNQAVQALQAILNEKKDYYVQVREQDPYDAKKENAYWTSVKFAANNLLGSMPLDGLEAYELAVGAEAKSLLGDAKKHGDRQLLADVAQRFCHTKAGIEANEIDATLYLARGQVFTAALRFEKLLHMNPERSKLSDLTLFKAALAFRRAGDKKNYDETWKRLETNLQGQAGLKIGDDLVPVAKLQDVLTQGAISSEINVHDWPSWRGNKTNTAQASGSPPLLDSPLWKRPLFLDKMDGSDLEDPDREAMTRVRAAIDQVNAINQPVLSGFFPIASQGIMVYRSYLDIRAVALKDLEQKNDEDGRVYKFKPGEILWKSLPTDRSLAVLLQKPRTRGKADQWLDSYKNVPGFNSFLYDNTLLGTLVTDHRNVYSIDDIAVPPHPAMFLFNPNFGFNPQFNQFNAQELMPLLKQNELHATEILSGKRVWDLGSADKDFKDSHFLSLPISVGGKLYVLNEKLLEQTQGGVPNFGFPATQLAGESELRLICIDPNKIVDGKPFIDKDSIQVLGNVVQYNRFLQDLSRRVNAAQMAYGEGVLVCPTNAGEIFGIDLMTRSLVWSYPYRENSYQQIHLPGMQVQPNFNPGIKTNQFATTTIVSKWKSAPPAIQDGKIVFTAPDADSIHCVNLRDGKPVWRKSQSEGDQYMAGVFQGKVLIVGKMHVRILSLKDGSELRKIYTGDLPSGQGVASKGIYYLPLKKGEILAIDIERGDIKAHNRSAVAGAAPGNLVFYEGMVLSQSATEVVAYPQLTARLDLARVEAANAPDNLAKLTDYGDLLLKDGQVQLAVDSLLKVYERKPPEALAKRVRERLFEALTDLMQVDFDRASRDYLPVYQSLCSVPENNLEEQGRKSKFYRLVGQGRESQGNLVEAFQMYKEFGSLPIHRDQGGIASLDDPTIKIPVNVWLRGRISGMLALAKPDQREPLEAKIAEEWKGVQEKKDLDAIRSFVGMFDAPFRVGREARVRLAELIMERNERNSFLEAELYLQQVRGGEFRSEPQTGGRALAALAQLEEKKGTIDSMRLAADYYRDLRRDFGPVPVRGTKTGADLFNDLATDKRFLPFLDDAVAPFATGKIAAHEIGRGNPGVPGFVLHPEGDHTPFARGNRLILEAGSPSNPKVRLVDVATGKDHWPSASDLGHVQMNQQMNTQIYSYLYQQANSNQAYYPNARFRFCHVKGHLIVFQVGVMVYCLDGDTGKKLWEMQTVDQMLQQNGFFQPPQVIPDGEGNPDFIFWNQQSNQRFRVSLGRIGAVQAAYVAVIGYKGLTVVDPINGRTMWKKNDVAVNTHLFGDDQYLFAVEINDGGSVGAGRTLRANDGEVLNVPDFSNAYQGRVKVLGRQILAAHPTPGNFTLHLYDILSGKDTWSKVFAPGSVVLQTEDRDLTGVLEPTGQVTILDVATGKQLLTTNIVQHRITIEDVKNLRHPLLLQDADRYYLALNRPIDARVSSGVLNNFNTATRCQVVNGWFVALHKHDGQRQVAGKDVPFKKGDMAWHSFAPMSNQMIVLDQFEQMPVLLFTARYNMTQANGSNPWVTVTQSLLKSTGKVVFDSGSKPSNSFPLFSVLQVDLKSRAINLIGYNYTVQHYVDEGKGPPPQQGAMLAPATGPMVGSANFAPPDPLLFNPGIRVMRRPLNQVPIQVPVEPAR